MKISAIVTGASGMVGEGVLHQCLNHSEVEKVLVIGRKPCGTTHPKLKEVLVTDFFNLKPIEHELAGYNACYFCLGTSSVGMKEPEYKRITYDLTLNLANTLVKLNPDMTFCYISGAGTDSTEKGSLMWARVKGKTENDLKKLPFKNVYAFRPGFIKPGAGMKNTLGGYKYLGWLYPIFKTLAPNSGCTLEQIGQAMINATQKGYTRWVIEVPDIIALAK